MSMFDMMKKAKDMYAKTKEMQKRLEVRRVEVSDNGVTILANGKQEIISIQLSDELAAGAKEKMERALLKACNEVSEKTRKIMEEEAQSMMGGASMPDMMNFLK